MNPHSEIQDLFCIYKHHQHWLTFQNASHMLHTHSGVVFMYMYNAAVWSAVINRDAHFKKEVLEFINNCVWLLFVIAIIYVQPQLTSDRGRWLCNTTISAIDIYKSLFLFLFIRFYIQVPGDRLTTQFTTKIVIFGEFSSSSVDFSFPCLGSM